MPPPTLADLPPPPPGKSGWPWTEASPPLPAARPDGSPWPQICIVTPSYNQGQYVEETIRSILLQGYPNLAYGVVDGGSSDATADVLARYRPFLDFCISEPDEGQVDAIAKGFRRLPAGLVNWINSDDVLAQGALAALGGASETATCITGHVVNFSAAGMRRRVILGDLAFATFAADKGTWHQPGVWLRADPTRLLPLLDPGLHIVFDWLYYLRFFMEPQTVAATGQDLVLFRVHGMAKTQQGSALGVHERLAAARLALAEARTASQRRLMERRLALAQRHVWTVESLAAAAGARAAAREFLARMLGDAAVCRDRFALGMLRRKLLGRC